MAVGETDVAAHINTPGGVQQSENIKVNCNQGKTRAKHLPFFYSALHKRLFTAAAVSHEATARHKGVG